MRVCACKSVTHSTEVTVTQFGDFRLPAAVTESHIEILAMQSRTVCDGGLAQKLARTRCCHGFSVVHDSVTACQRDTLSGQIGGATEQTSCVAALLGWHMRWSVGTI